MSLSFAVRGRKVGCAHDNSLCERPGFDRSALGSNVAPAGALAGNRSDARTATPVSAAPPSPPLALLAPDKFKGTFSSAEICSLLTPELVRFGWSVESTPMADGGEGTAAALVAALGGEWRTTIAHDPLGRPVQADYALLSDGATAVVEVAAASGLWRIADGERDALAASSAGTGELIIDACRAGASEVIIAAGGSATTDGGQGAIAAIGHGISGIRLLVACDVRTPWERAAEVFAPQKGASAQLTRTLAARLEALASGLRRDPRGVPMTGAAGGLAGGLWSEFDAELVSGADLVLDAARFADRLARANLVVTGEGSIDAQTLEGKIVGEVAARARAAGVRCAAIVGRDRLAPGEMRALGLAAVVEASRREELERAPRQLLVRLGLIDDAEREDAEVAAGAPAVAGTAARRSPKIDGP
jgi:glycerate kinase